MKTAVYCSYDVLGHEKKPYYSVHAPASEVFDRVEITIPDDIISGENQLGEPILNLGGAEYLLSEVLTNAGNNPVIRWYNGKEYQAIKV